ncbi:MAG TPA: hypothetical protein VI504_10875 [Candidatus Eisenbacteria bacterium]|jgi:hypothetical protein
MKADHPIPYTDTRESIAYAELLKLAHEEGLKSISTSLVLQPSEENGRLAIVKAAVETERGHFEGLGDADPGNVDAFLVPHLIRVAETRAKARALRDAVNCGVVSSEELDDVSLDQASRPGPGAPAPPSSRPARNEAPPARPRGNGGARSPRGTTGNGSPEPMTEGQRRYLFRIMAGQGYQREAAENRLKEIFEVGSLTEITKTAAMKMIDELLQTSAPGNGGGNGPASRPLH